MKVESDGGFGDLHCVHNNFEAHVAHVFVENFLDEKFVFLQIHLFQINIGFLSSYCEMRLLKQKVDLPIFTLHSIFENVNQIIENLGRDWAKLTNVTTDGAPSINVTFRDIK